MVVFSKRENTKPIESSASFYYQSVEEGANNYTIFGSVNSINQSYFEQIPSYTEDEYNQRWGSLGDYYIKVYSYYEDSNRVTKVNFQYKLKEVFLIRNEDDRLSINDVYYFSGDYVTYGLDKIVTTNKIIEFISLRQYYIFVDDADGSNSIDLGLSLYFGFSDSTYSIVTFDYVNYAGLSGEGYEYEKTESFIMDYLNISQTLSNVESNSQNTLDGYYNEGYNTGYNNGFADGVESQQMEMTDTYNAGYSAGYQAGYDTDSTIGTIFSGIIQVALVPVNFFLGMFNFEILGINLRAFIQALFTVAITIIIVKAVLGAKGGGSDG